VIKHICVIAQRSEEEVVMKIPDFKDENEIAAFMEEHDGFELLDKGLAEVIETPVERAGVRKLCFRCEN